MAITGYFIDLNWDYREFLLGFEPLEGTHSGENLCSVLLKRLQDYNITHRILAITTDNASNNQTLIDRLNDEIETLAEVTGAPVVRVPCIAHVIQLSLKGLLVHMKLEPSNESAEREFKPRPTDGNKDILATLNKVRAFAVFVNASSQRRDAFLKLQSGDTALVPIQDVKTRWNSTFLMLRRAKRIRSARTEKSGLETSNATSS
ncbi:hypothetical protein PMG11_11023 [Penicillium brasilianum]|uniref:DUF659 domain-containing protein n=1 Tax=Penicillium brasilianum TaxID=104259 RepID=A0A0F7U2P9_PENBI|nr:hypothetical protein PMG11_11023 [Penicillium brasilianum]